MSTLIEGKGQCHFRQIWLICLIFQSLERFLLITLIYKISMEGQYEQIPNDLFRMEDLTPMGLGICFPEPDEEHKLIREEIPTKKGRPKGLKNDDTKPKKSKEREGNPALKQGHWGAEENKRYHWFLQVHNKHFINKHLRRMDKIFKSMATFVGTREAEQCRSHHQKMQKKYRTFFQILHFLRNTFYSTTSVMSIQAELQANEVGLIDDLIDGNLIEKNLNLPEGTIPERENQQLQESYEEKEDLPKEIEESFRPDNLLNEDYSQDLLRDFH